ncbi:hypothetical protein IG631_20182 [Alternaria alternata]|nr:hypothetical protein IG631_20182 [Alternaria alternata]
MEEQAELDPAAAFGLWQAGVIRRQRCSYVKTKAREHDKIHYQQPGEGLSISKARHHVSKHHVRFLRCQSHPLARSVSPLPPTFSHAPLQPFKAL